MLSYAVCGYDPDNFKEIAKAVDGVLGESLKRYASFASAKK
ncbi:MAG: hypothetical protein ABIR71_10745 [Chthoniobacterales bacterium]